MALFNLRDLRAGLARNQRLIGLDPGSRSIGVALSDVGLSLASPYGVIRRGRLRDNAAEIIAIARKEGAGGLVVGLPLSMDGSVGPAAQSASDWALALSEESLLPTALWDERLSSAAVNRFRTVCQTSAGTNADQVAGTVCACAPGRCAGRPSVACARMPA